MRHPILALGFALCCVLATVPGNSTAAPINPATIDATFFAFPTANPSSIAYNGATDTFTMEQTLTAASPYTFFNSDVPSPATTVAEDFEGEFSLTAIIDGSGTFSGRPVP